MAYQPLHLGAWDQFSPTTIACGEPYATKVNDPVLGDHWVHARVTEKPDQVTCPACREYLTVGPILRQLIERFELIEERLK